MRRAALGARPRLMYEVFARTKSVCPICLRTIDAERAVAGDGFVHLIKTCPEHGFFDTLIWEGSADEYLAWGGACSGGEADDGCPNNCGLCAEHRSEGCCVLLELTRRCNLRCPVCFASAGGEGDLGLDEIARLYDRLMARGGPFNIQLSGGEPTIRGDLPEIVRLGRERGFTFFQLNTNGLRLASEAGYAEELREAGVSCAFLQFDGLRPASYEALRGRDISAEKLRAVDNCAAAGLPVVLVPTLAPGVNEDEIGGILWFGVDDSGTSCLTPIYTSSTRVPECFREGNGHMTEYSPTSAFWLFNRVANFAYLRYDLISKDIIKVIDELDTRNETEIPAVDAAAMLLYEQNPQLAIDFLTNFSVSTAQNMFERWQQLDQYLLVKYMDGNVKKEKEGKFLDNGNGRNIPASPNYPGYNQEWQKAVAGSTGDKLKVVKTKNLPE